MRSIAFALVLVGCGSSQGVSSLAVASELPRAGACQPFEEPGISNDGMGTECVPPERYGARESAGLWAQNGRALDAANCFVTAYEEAGTSDPWLAYQAGRRYHDADRTELARSYYERAIGTTHDETLSADARRGLAELDAN